MPQNLRPCSAMGNHILYLDVYPVHGILHKNDIQALALFITEFTNRAIKGRYAGVILVKQDFLLRGPRAEKITQLHTVSPQRNTMHPARSIIKKIFTHYHLCTFKRTTVRHLHNSARVYANSKNNKIFCHIKLPSLYRDLKVSLQSLL